MNGLRIVGIAVFALLFGTVDLRAEDGQVLREGTFWLQTFAPEQTRTVLFAALEAQGAYMQASDDTSLHLRVPVAGFDAALEIIEATGSVAERQMQTTDVTLEWHTLQSKERILQESRTRIKEMLQQARTVEDNLLIERDLALATKELEAIQGRMRFLDQRLKYVPLTLIFAPKATTQRNQTAQQRPFPWVASYGMESLLP